MTEPVKVTAPMKTPRNSSTFRIVQLDRRLVREERGETRERLGVPPGASMAERRGRRASK
jgi:hypothetical protein